jgi:hypothetical protein
MKAHKARGQLHQATSVPSAMATSRRVEPTAPETEEQVTQEVLACDCKTTHSRRGAHRHTLLGNQRMVQCSEEQAVELTGRCCVIQRLFSLLSARHLIQPTPTAQHCSTPLPSEAQYRLTWPMPIGGNPGLRSRRNIIISSVPEKGDVTPCACDVTTLNCVAVSRRCAHST